MIVKLSFLASAFNASVTDGIFKEEGSYCYARATEIMSTQSSTGFEWTIKVMGDDIVAGIASQFKPEESNICNYDPTAITYYAWPNGGIIRLGSRVIHENLPGATTGDIIRFQFQPERKKLVIHSVRH